MSDQYSCSADKKEADRRAQQTFLDKVKKMLGINRERRTRPERRRAVRLLCCEDVRCYYHTNLGLEGSCHGAIRTASQAGISLITPEPITRENQLVAITVFWHNKTIVVDGQVVHYRVISHDNKPLYLLGIKLVNIPKEWTMFIIDKM